VSLFKQIAIFTLLFLEGCVGLPESNNKPIVNDVTKLNPIAVDRIVVPHNVSEIIEAVKGAKGPVSIGGGRFSMGGQTATEGTLQIDMREFNKVVSFSPQKKEVTVESGITWRQLQEVIDPYNLSVKIMQTYSDFTVGGSLSVNAHGRYIGYGPLVLSAKRIGLVLADGSYVNASPEKNPEIFYGAIGGYGGIGVIADTTLELVDNVKVHRVSKVMPFSQYKDYFVKEVRDNPKAIFHNADIYPNSYDTVRATTYEETGLPLTREQRLIPKEQSYWLDRTLIGIISEAPGGKGFRQYVVDPILFHDDRVTWRNYEASYTALELEPSSRRDSTYILQEYFVPVEQLNEFVPQMAKVLNDNHVNVINISIRHSKQDPGTLLAWAKQEVFAFVIYYKQGTGIADREHVGIWTRQLIDVAVANGGRYYLPYQIHATEQQFKAAYPGFDKFFDLKKRVDPTNKFRNKLWDAYYPPQ
jgi:FAD/FMN-containing dehydrogenase